MENIQVSDCIRFAEFLQENYSEVCFYKPQAEKHYRLKRFSEYTTKFPKEATAAQLLNWFLTPEKPPITFDTI